MTQKNWIIEGKNWIKGGGGGGQKWLKKIGYHLCMIPNDVPWISILIPFNLSWATNNSNIFIQWEERTFYGFDVIYKMPSNQKILPI